MAKRAIYANDALHTTSKYASISPATCTVGGIIAGTVLTGQTLESLLQQVLAPYIVPTFSSLALSVTSPMEVGAALSGSKTFTWATTTSGNVASNSIGILNITSGTTLATGLSNDGAEALSIGTMNNTFAQTWTWRITGCSTQNNSFQRDVSKCSIYPVYYGKVTSGSRPAVTNSLVTTGCIAKPVVNSTGTVTVTFSSVGQWTWLAIPQTSTTKTCWYVDGLNNDLMLYAGSKYPDECQLNITSAESCWSTVCYKVYMSRFAATDASPIQFRNS